MPAAGVVGEFNSRLFLVKKSGTFFFFFFFPLPVFSVFIEFFRKTLLG